MTVRLSSNGIIELDGVCPIEDAEALHRYLIANQGSLVDWTACTAAHTSIIQILLAAKPNLHGPPGSDFLRHHVEPLLQPSEAAAPCPLEAHR